LGRAPGPAIFYYIDKAGTAKQQCGRGAPERPRPGGPAGRPTLCDRRGSQRSSIEPRGRVRRPRDAASGPSRALRWCCQIAHGDSEPSRDTEDTRRRRGWRAADLASVAW